MNILQLLAVLGGGDIPSQSVRPVADAPGSSANWEPTGEATNWECVKDAVADDNTFAAIDNWDGGWVRFTLADAVGNPSSEQRHRVIARHNYVNQTSDPVYIRLQFDSGATTYMGGWELILPGWAATVLELPQYTIDAIDYDDMEISFDIQTGNPSDPGYEGRISQAYLLIGETT